MFKLCDEYSPEGEKKPVIECRLLGRIVLGQKVAIVPYDHPSSQYNGMQCLTSEASTVDVVVGLQVGFETKKSIYKVVT